MGTKIRERQYTYDAALALHNTATAITADDVMQVDGADQIIDLGDDALFIGDMIVDVSALDIVGNDELYELVLEGSDSATFASGIEEVAVLRLGANETMLPNGDVDSDVGRYVVPFNNARNGRHYRYLRGSVDVTGATASITFEAYISKRK